MTAKYLTNIPNFIPILLKAIPLKQIYLKMSDLKARNNLSSFAAIKIYQYNQGNAAHYIEVGVEAMDDL